MINSTEFQIHISQFQPSVTDTKLHITISTSLYKKHTTSHKQSIVLNC